MRQQAAALAAILSVLSAPLAAQEEEPAPALEDLIPDEAVEDPEAWAQRGVPSETLAGDSGPELDADAPMQEMPLVTVPWPADIELPEIAPLEPEEEIDFVQFEDVLPPLPQGTDVQVSDELVLSFPSEQTLFPYTEEFLERFEALSSIEQLEDEDNVARLAAQGREDEALLNRMLRVYGYYDAQVIRSAAGIQPGEEIAAEGEGARPAVRFDVIPGPQYQVGAVDLGALRETGDDFALLRETYGVFPGDPLLMDAVEDERFDLDAALGENGYPFAVIENPEILVAHDRREGDVAMEVTPGGKYNFGTVVSSRPDFLPGEHLADIARFEPGDLYMHSDELDLRQAILATGIVGSVTITPVETQAPSGGQPGTVDMRVDLTEAPLRTIAGSIGYGTQEGIRLEGSWEHRNLFPPEGMLRFRGIAGTQEQLLGVTFRKNNFRGRDKILTVDAFASTLDYEAYDARTVSLVGTYERVSTLLFQKPLSWSAGLELTATAEREADAHGNFGPRQTYFVAAVPLYAQIDTSDDLLNPSRGWRLGGRLSPEVSHTNGAQSFYLRSQVDASYYRQVSERVVLAGRVRLASIPGADLADIAPSRRLYAGGGGSVRGYGYQEIGPRNSQGDPAGGRSLTEMSLEARIRTPLLDGALGIVPFIDAGTVGDDATPGFDEIKYGAGIGARYHSSFGPIRFDVAFPINPGPNDSWIAVYVALGQAF
jgi:translocation and assembly module TamA